MKNTIETFKTLIENKLDILNSLVIKDNKIVPNTEILNKQFINTNCLDDLFQYYRGKLIFTNRFMHLVAEITDRQVLTGHYFLEVR